MPLNVGLRSCGALCPHPGCWDAVRKQEKGITKSLPPLDLSSSDDSDSELDLPTQSVCNLLADFGESPTDRYPVSTGGRPSHQWDTPMQSAQSVIKRKEATFSPKKLHAPHNTKASIYSKKKSTGVPGPRPRPRQPRMPLVEVQEVFDRTDLNSQWDETFVTKQYYIWVSNPRNQKKRRMGGQQAVESQTNPNGPVLMKDMTECMVPAEIEQQREKKQPRTASPPAKSIQFKKAAMSQQPAQSVPAPIDVDMDGINELLALPKDVLLRVLENTKKSDFTSKGKIHDIVQECIQGNDSARMMLSTRELLRQKKMKILNIPKGTVHKSLPAPPPKPVFQVDDEQVIDRMSSANTPVKEKDACSDNSSVESFPRYRKPLPRIQGHPHLSYHLVGPGELIQSEPDSVRLPIKAKLPSISLGLPELPSGVKTTRAFTYNSRNMMDFTLGPVVSPPTTHRSSESGDYSEHGTTVKVNAPMSGIGYTDFDQAIHSVSPALSTKVPIAPAGTPATFMSPTKSAPNLRDVSRDPTQLTFNLSVRAQPSSSKDMRDTTFLSSPTTGLPLQQLIPSPSPALDPSKFPTTPDDQGLDTIRETARETGVDGSVISSSHGIMGDRMEEQPKLMLQTSTMTNINTSASPLPKSARSVESCPSPEQWPLISESSFEKLIPRSSISEPALSGRSGRRPISRGLDDNGRDYARKVMVEKNSAESPAPPPPSPEPKDGNEFRARKDLKSRESLSMAPLFEVNEMDEDVSDQDRLMEGNGQRKQVRKIHAVIPQANSDADNFNKTVENEEQEEEEVMVSQITVMHVAPKGTSTAHQHGSGGAGNVNREKEKVQETFLNVDIPAEEISSCKAEHGSSRQEDISSTNESPAKSEVTTTNSQVSASGTSKVTEQDQEEESNTQRDNNEQGEEQYEKDREQEEEKLESVEGEGKDTLDERQYLEMQSDFIHRDRYDSAKLNSEDSGVSPELVCDSARFLSHDLVSPMEGEMDEGQLQMMSLMQQVEGRSDADKMTFGEIKNETGELTNFTGEEIGGINGEEEADIMAEEYGKILGELEDAGEREILGEESKEEEEETVGLKSAESNETAASEDVEPPGSFFFQNTGDGQDNDNTDTAEFVISTSTEDKIEIRIDVASEHEGEVRKESMSKEEELQEVDEDIVKSNTGKGEINTDTIEISTNPESEAENAGESGEEIKGEGETDNAGESGEEIKGEGETENVDESGEEIKGESETDNKGSKNKNDEESNEQLGANVKIVIETVEKEETNKDEGDGDNVKGDNNELIKDEEKSEVDINTPAENIDNGEKKVKDENNEIVEQSNDQNENSNNNNSEGQDDNEKEV